MSAVYTHVATTSHTTPKSRQLLSARLNDLMMKSWPLVGIPLVISAVSALASAEETLDIPKPEMDMQRSGSRYASLDLSQEIEARGYDFMKVLYRHNLEPIMSTWGSHQYDFEWLVKRVIYGLFLADRSILNTIETELVVVAAIMAQGLRAPSMWHLRGLRRLGIGLDAVERVCEIIRTCGEWCGKDTKDWVRAFEVEGEVE
jgi:hypothetical protein